MGCSKQDADVVTSRAGGAKPPLPTTREPEGKGAATCRDRNCDPSRGDLGCMASIVNEGAIDGDDGVWVSKWNDCPVMAAQAKADAERRAHDDAEMAWDDRELHR